MTVLPRSRLLLVASALYFAFFASPAFADLEFLTPDIAPDGTILYAARVDVPGAEGYDTLFAARADSGETVQLTFYPEAVSLLDDGRRLQIRNRYGVFMTERGFTDLKPLPGFPSFARGSPVPQGKLVDSRPSPDGGYMLYLSPTSPARGDLLLFDVSRSTQTVVARGVEFSVGSFPAAWSPDSRHFAYARSGELFYYSIDQHRAGRVPEESWRRVGPGRINQARWSANGSLYVLRERSLYRIMPEEFFTQAIYAGIVAPGSLVGKAPFPFDPNFDSFWISPDGAKVLLCKDGRNIFLYRLDPDDFGQENAVSALPYLFLQGDTVISHVIWPRNDEVTIVTGSLKDAARGSGVYRIVLPAKGQEGLSASFQELDSGGALSFALSPDETRIALSGPAGVSVRRYGNWAEERRFAADGAISALWVGNDRLIIAGSRLIELASLADGSRNVLALSQAGTYAWAEGEPGKVAVKAGDRAFVSPAKAPSWTGSASYAPRPAAAANLQYRVYLDSLAAGSYKNLVMVRSAATLGTASLMPKPGKGYAPFPDRDDPRTPGVFNHGSRIRRREVALVVNAHGGAEGLVAVLNALRAYGVRATFFVNGDFIRRNPGATRLIAQSGHETGNLFFSVFDATDARYRIDAEFVKRGLARTEDEYFRTTGKELSLLWHPPFYALNGVLLEAGAAMNYTYVGRDIDPLDWVGRSQGSLSQALYAGAHDIVERATAAAKPGSIIPIQLGVPEGGRGDYLFNELPLLLNALLAEGYEIVPVSRLMDHAE